MTSRVGLVGGLAGERSGSVDGLRGTAAPCLTHTGDTRAGDLSVHGFNTGSASLRGTQRMAIAPIRFYQVAISPLTGPRCKFYPSCSHFAIDSVRTHGVAVGTVLATWRVLRCNPWSVGGVDDVPARGERLFRTSRNNSAMVPDPSASPI